MLTFVCVCVWVGGVQFIMGSTFDSKKKKKWGQLFFFLVFEKDMGSAQNLKLSAMVCLLKKKINK